MIILGKTSGIDCDLIHMLLNCGEVILCGDVYTVLINSF